IYGVLDPGTGVLDYVNAGHDPAFLLRLDGHMTEHGATALPVGVVDSDEFDPLLKQEQVTLAPGELFFLYTDGVTEAMDKNGAQFGLEKIQLRLEGRSPAAIIRSLKD